MDCAEVFGMRLNAAAIGTDFGGKAANIRMISWRTEVECEEWLITSTSFLSCIRKLYSSVTNFEIVLKLILQCTVMYLLAVGLSVGLLYARSSMSTRRRRTRHETWRVE